MDKALIPIAQKMEPTLDGPLVSAFQLMDLFPLHLIRSSAHLFAWLVLYIYNPIIRQTNILGEPGSPVG